MLLNGITIILILVSIDKLCIGNMVTLMKNTIRMLNGI